MRDYSHESQIPQAYVHHAGDPPATTPPAPLATHDDLFGTHVFSFPFRWQNAHICEFHADPVPENHFRLLGQNYFRLPTPWVCPCCNEKVYWAMRGWADAEYPRYNFTEKVTNEFLATITRFARMFGLGAGQ